LKHKDFLSPYHKKTSRNYLERVTDHNKPECAVKAKKWGFDYWDGDRKYGFGGYSYDGRWKPLARDLIDYYSLKPGSRVLDIGCGKAFILYEMKQLMPDLVINGIDVSQYALDNTLDEIRPFLKAGNAVNLPFQNDSFDLVFSLNTFHNLYIYDLEKAVKELERVKKPGGSSYITVESYRNETEKANLLYWQLTCECFFTPQEWEWLYKQFGYTGDFSFIYFE
jgi:protein-L-isoaspartate(D-aspartate) O-methyltransferase